MSDLLGPLQFEFMQRAYAAGLIAGVVAPTVGTFLVLRRLALIADGLGHISFAGLAGSLFLGIHPLLGALVAALVGSVGIERLRAARRAAGDVAIGVYASVGLGLGLVLARLAGAVNVDLFGFLFGSLVAVPPSEVFWIAAVGLAALAVIGLMYRALLAIVIDEESARAAGVPVDWINQALAALAGLTVIVSMRVVGVLLVSALMVLPVAASLQFARGLGQTILYAAAFGTGSVVVGLSLAYHLDLPAGATVVLAAASFLGLSIALSSLRARRT